MDASPRRAGVPACRSHRVARRSPCGSRNTSQAFPHRPPQAGATQSRRPAVPPASGWGVTQHQTRVFSDTHHGFSRIAASTVVRFAVGAQGTHNRKPPPGPPRPPPGPCFPVHRRSVFSFPGARVQAPFAGKSRKCAQNPGSRRKATAGLSGISRYFLAKKDGPEPMSTNRQSFCVVLATSAVRWEILQMCAESRLPGKMARSAAFAAAPVALRAGPAAVDAKGHTASVSAAKTPLIRGE